MVRIIIRVRVVHWVVVWHSSGSLVSMNIITLHRFNLFYQIHLHVYSNDISGFFLHFTVAK